MIFVPLISLAFTLCWMFFRSCYLNQLFCKFWIYFSKYYRPLGSWSALIKSTSLTMSTGEMRKRKSHKTNCVNVKKFFWLSQDFFSFPLNWVNSDLTHFSVLYSILFYLLSEENWLIFIRIQDCALCGLEQLLLHNVHQRFRVCVVVEEFDHLLITANAFLQKGGSMCVVDLISYLDVHLMAHWWHKPTLTNPSQLKTTTVRLYCDLVLKLFT